MGPPPVVTGISPKEATAGTKLTIRGERVKSSRNYPTNTTSVNLVMGGSKIFFSLF